MGRDMIILVIFCPAEKIYRILKTAKKGEPWAKFLQIDPNRNLPAKAALLGNLLFWPVCCACFGQSGLPGGPKSGFLGRDGPIFLFLAMPWPSYAVLVHLGLCRTGHIYGSSCLFF